MIKAELPENERGGEGDRSCAARGNVVSVRPLRLFLPYSMRFRNALVVVSVLGALMVPVLWSQGRKKEDVRKDPPPHQAAASVQLQLEVIEMNHEEAAAVLSSQAPADDAAGLRDEIQKFLEDGRARLADTVIGVTDFAGVIKMHSVQEYIYPTEHEPPSAPNKVRLSFGEKKGEEWKDALTMLMTPPTPTAFEKRFLGMEFDAAVGLAADNRRMTIDFHVAHSSLTALKSWQEIKNSLGNKYQLNMPLFFTNRLATTVSLADGATALMGVLSPKGEDGEVDLGRKLLLFLKADVLDAAERKALPWEPDMQVQVDLFEVDHATMQTLLAAPVLIRKGALLRGRLEELVKEGEAERFDTLLLRTSARGEITSVREWIYPTEYEPMELSMPTNGPLFSPTSGAGHSEIPIPTAYETRDVGAVMRIDATREAGGLIDLDWETDYTEMAGLVSHGRRKTPGGNVYDLLMPDIDSMSPAGLLKVKAGTWKFVAVAQQPKKSDKRLLILLRADLLR